MEQWKETSLCQQQGGQPLKFCNEIFFSRPFPDEFQGFSGVPRRSLMLNMRFIISFYKQHDPLQLSVESTK